MRRLHVVALSVVLAASFSTSARATAEVRIEPHPIPQCSTAHFYASMSNETSLRQVCHYKASLMRDGRKIVGELPIGHFVLSPGETHIEEFDFVMPAIPQGTYDLELHADLGNGSTTVATARFRVCANALDNECAAVVPEQLLSVLATNASHEQLSAPSGSGDRRLHVYSTKTTTWQDCKQLYR